MFEYNNIIYVVCAVFIYFDILFFPYNLIKPCAIDCLLFFYLGIGNTYKTISLLFFFKVDVF